MSAKTSAGKDQRAQAMRTLTTMAGPRQPCPETVRFARLMWEPGEVRELRVPKYNRFGHTASGYFDAPESLAAAAARFDGEANVFLSLNPVLPDLMARACNRVDERASNATADAEIQYRRWLFLDIDPNRPSGISSTDAERERALAVLNSVVEFLAAQGWPGPITAMSGNGYYALFRIDLLNDPASGDLLKGVLGTLAKRFDTEGAHLDTTVHNASRIIGLIGTLKVKGENLADRPHRHSHLISVPEELEVVTEERLKAVALMSSGSSESSSDSGRDRKDSRSSRPLTDLLDEAGIEYRTQPADAQRRWRSRRCFRSGRASSSCLMSTQRSFSRHGS